MKTESYNKRSIKFSIICPVYNSESFLSECIESVIKQNYQNWELILVNDGSTDGSTRICKAFSQKDARIVLINQENQGPYQARINGIKEATGDYVLFLDSDDCFIYNSLNVLNNHLLFKNINFDLLLFNFVKEDNSKYAESSFNYYENDIDGTHNILDYVFYKKNIGNLCRFCVKKSLLSNDICLSINSSRYTEDAIFLFKVLLSAHKMRIITNELYYYRNNLNSITHNLTSDDRYNRFVNYNYILENIYYFNKYLELSNDNISLYSWIPISYIVSSNKDKYRLFKSRCDDIRNSFMFCNISKQNKNLTKTRSIIVYLLEKRLFIFLRLFIFFFNKRINR